VRDKINRVITKSHFFIIPEKDNFIQFPTLESSLCENELVPGKTIKRDIEHLLSL
jgi:hypothetical protein